MGSFHGAQEQLRSVGVARRPRNTSRGVRVTSLSPSRSVDRATSRDRSGILPDLRPGASRMDMQSTAIHGVPASGTRGVTHQS